MYSGKIRSRMAQKSRISSNPPLFTRFARKSQAHRGYRKLTSNYSPTWSQFAILKEMGTTACKKRNSASSTKRGTEAIPLSNPTLGNRAQRLARGRAETLCDLCVPLRLNQCFLLSSFRSQVSSFSSPLTVKLSQAGSRFPKSSGPTSAFSLSSQQRGLEPVEMAAFQFFSLFFTQSHLIPPNPG